MGPYGECSVFAAFVCSFIYFVCVLDHLSSGSVFPCQSYSFFIYIFFI